MNHNILELERQDYLTNLKGLKDHKKFEQLQESFKIHYTHDALSIQGTNKVKLEDVKKVIDGESIPHYSERDVKEVVNHYKAINHVYQMVKDNVEMSEDGIKDIHEILTDGILNGGNYRNVNIRIPGATHQPPDYIKVYDRMKRYFYTLSQYEGESLEKAVFAHAELAKVHPFLDANGRLARLVMNYFLMKAGYIPVSMCKDLKERYIKVLETFKVEKNIEPFVLFVEELLLERYKELNEQLA
ncbi:MAG: Fic family protein [Acholeplasmataceae bacterium]|nr:Fic family protein [Acholeplasmataceae bacterium]